MEAPLAGPSIELPDKFNVVSVLIDDKIARGLGDRVAIYCEDRQLSYRDVFDMTNRTGNALRDLGVQIEKRVLLLLNDGPEFVASFLGAMKIGAVAVPVNTLARPQDYEYLLNDSRAVCCIADATLVHNVEEVRANLKYLQHLIVVGDAKPGQLSFADLTRNASPELTAAETSKDDPAFWLYSSGTTGFPKGTVHLHHDIVFTCECYAKLILGITEKDLTFSVSKLFFAYGLGNALNHPFYVGAATVLVPARPNAAQTFEIVQRYRPTLFFSVPTMYAQLLAVPDAEKTYDTRSIRRCVSGGESLSKALYEQWLDRFGVEILNGMGSTELTHNVISNRPGQVRAGSTGQVVPGYELKLVDDDGQVVPRCEIGNLLVKGDSTCAYYRNQHEKTKQTIVGEWIRTGDKFYQDDDGYYWYAGRSDDMLKVSGQWMSPIEVESTLIEFPGVLESAVVGVADAEGLVKPMAFVVLKQGVTGNPELAAELQQFVRSRIAKYKYPRQVIFVDELPKTATGKIQRYKLRQQLQSQ